MAWMRAVTGSWNTVKQSHAYKMVSTLSSKPGKGDTQGKRDGGATKEVPVQKITGQ